MQTPRTDLFPETLLVARSGQRIYTTSRKVAAHFGKAHKNVLRDIEKLLTELADMTDLGVDRRLNFEPTMYPVPGPKGAVRMETEYHLSHDGFALLAMGFTGREALRWKVAFLAAFRQQEAALAELQARYAAALDIVRPKLRPVVNDFADGLTRTDTAQWLGCSVASVSYQRTQARRLGLLPAGASVRVGGVA